MRLKSKQVNWEFLFLAVCTIAFFSAFIIRLMFGVETSDEAYYAATGYRLFQGNVPFGDMWEVNATDAFIMAPFLAVRSLFLPNTDGIQLYLRLCFILLNALPAFAVYQFAAITIKKSSAYLLALFYLFYAPFQLYTFSYNNMGDAFITLSVCLLLIGKDSGKWYHFLLLGISTAFAVLAYPTLSVFCVVFAAVILLLFPIRLGWRFCLYYIAGGILIAIPLIAYILTAVSFGQLLENLQFIIVGDPAHVNSFSAALKKIPGALYYLCTPLFENKNGFSAFWLAMVITACFKKTKSLAHYFVVFYPVVCVMVSIGKEADMMMNFIFCMTFLMPVAVLLAEERMCMLKKVAVEWGVTMLPYFVYSFSTGGGSHQAVQGLIPAVVVSAKLILEVFNEKPIRWFEKKAARLFLFMAIAAELITFYGGVYRDAPITQMTAKIGHGIYQGLYTTPERKQHLEDLENVMDQVEKPGKNVMILYHSCYAYLMLDMVPKIPSTWGCYNVQGYGFDNQDVFMQYLSSEENIPEIILIIDIPEKFDYAGQCKEKYAPYYPQLNSFVLDNYAYMGAFQQGDSGIVEKYVKNS